MRPIFVGLIFFIVGVVGYLAVQVYYHMMTLETALIYTFAAIAICSMPIAAVVEFVRWRRQKEEKDSKKEKPPPPA